jgi:lipopolysaccharide transport system ATP-binding protein
MSNVVIKAENISKLYRLGEVGTGTLSHDLNRWFAKARGKEDPYSKLGEANDRTKKGNSDYAWALQDISFEVGRGEALGIIGKNGAGKSTLLKILSRTTTPTTGDIKLKGRVASLLEVGTGFHPDLTGRENIYLNGAILGMRKKEIQRKFDAIVDFAGVERYIETPVKRYSSGMYVRLAFAVAAYLDSEILVVDEVLAVGDAEFQKKCLGKMGEVANGEGRTVLFVSHNMASVKKLCSRGALLIDGKLSFIGSIGETIRKYSENSQKTSEAIKHLMGNQQIEIKDILVNNSGSGVVNIYEEIAISVVYETKSPSFDVAEFFVIIYNSEDEEILSFFQRDSSKLIDVASNAGGTITIQFRNCLKPGIYRVAAGVFDPFRNFIDWIAPYTAFTVDSQFHFGGKFDNRLGSFFLNAEWKNDANNIQAV